MPRPALTALFGGLLMIAACHQEAPQTGASSAEGGSVAFARHIPANLPSNIQPPTAPARITGRLRLPPGEGRVPAVVILHGTGGVDGRGARYAEALLAAGIASLEVDMWTPRGIGAGNEIANRPRIVDTVPDAYGAARYLAAHPRVDAARLGVMGLSFGGVQSVLVATDTFGPLYSAGGADFRASAPLYPTCSLFVDGRPFERALSPGFPRIPMLLLIGDRDDYDGDGGEACRRIGVQGTPEARARATVHVYPGATHAWETTRPSTFRDPAAARGRGGIVRVERDAATTADSVRRVTAFFRETLAAP